MDYVLGLSLTSSAVRWVLVEGDEGEPVDRGVFDGDAVRAMTADAIVDELLAGSVGDRVVRAVGVTFAAASEATARALVGALTARGFDGVTAVAELAAVDALACGIADVAELDGVVVCVVDDDGAVVAVLDAGGVTVERVAGRAGDPRFADAGTRAANAAACEAEFAGTFASATQAEWMQRLAAFRGPWEAVRDSYEVGADPQALANGYVTSVDHPAGVEVSAVRSPVRVDRRPHDLSTAPDAWQHTEEILLEVGLDWDRIIELKNDGVVP